MDTDKAKTHLKDHLRILKSHWDQAVRQKEVLERSIASLDEKIKECTELLSEEKNAGN